MKQLCFTVMILLLTPLAVAQNAPTVLKTKNPAIGNVHYIIDMLKVPLRSGQSSQHRIVHRGLKSGQTVTLLEVDKSSGYSHVKTSKGLEGWIPSQYLIATPTAEIRLKTAQQTIAKLKQKAGPMGEQLLSAQKENRQLKQSIVNLENSKDQVSKELSALRAISSNAITLDKANKELLNSNEALKNQHDTLAAENERLQSQLRNDGFINGALVLFAGMILTLIVQYFTQTRRKSEWG